MEEKEDCKIEQCVIDLALITQNRYIVSISFKLYANDAFKKVKNIAEPVKTIKTAREYKGLVDNTVKSAFVFDIVSNKIIETWV